MTQPSPGPELNLRIRTANRDRKAEIAVDPGISVAEVLEAAKENWALPGDYEYIVRCERLGTQLRPTATLIGSGIQSGDVLEIQPLADAGSPRGGWLLVWMDERDRRPWA